MRIQKTFYEEDEPGNLINWVDSVVWAYVNTIEKRDPAEWEYELANKIKITIEIYNENES